MQRWELEEVPFLRLLFLSAIGSKVLTEMAGGQEVWGARGERGFIQESGRVHGSMIARQHYRPTQG